MLNRVASVVYCSAFALVSLGIIAPATAGAQNLPSSNFVSISSEFKLGCALRVSRAVKSVSPARIVGRASIRLMSAAAISARVRALQREGIRLKQLAASKGIARRRGRVAEELSVLRSLRQQCRALSSAGCNNGLRDPFESGVDCGGVCSMRCSETIPTPVPTIPVPTATPTPTPTAPVLVNSECSDGVDNDDDGMVDFGNGDLSMADFGCLGPNGQETSTDYGYTVFTPSSDSRVVYVSSSTGNDDNSGLHPTTPKRTILAGYELLRNNSADWLLLKRGDTFDGTDYRMRLAKSLDSDPEGNALFDKSGRSPTERMVIGSYGTSTQRPILKTGSRSGFVIWNERNLALVGLDFYASRCDPNSADFFDVSCPNGINAQYSNLDILIEDNRVRYFGGGINIQAPTDGGGTLQWDNVTVRRNIIENCYSGLGHSQGMFSSGAGRLLIQQNVMYHNGWSADYRLNLLPAAFNATAWRAVTDGRIDVVLNGQAYRLASLNFSNVSSYADVAAVLENGLQGAVPAGVTVDVSFNGKWLIFKANLPSNENYTVRAYTGSVPGTNINTSGLLNTSGSNPRTPAATIFNRNYYGSAGFSNTTLDGNITAVGASGGMQARMGGIIRNNLALDEPVGISVGHAENPVGVPFTATIENNVVLGSSDVGHQPRGFGLGFGGMGFTVRGNIIAHNVRGTGNLEGLFSDTDLGSAYQSYQDGVIEDNIVYNWKSPSGVGTTLGIRHFVFFNVLARNNQFVQPRGGSLVNMMSDQVPSGLILSNDRFYAAAGGNNLFTIANVGMNAAQFGNQVGINVNTSAPNFPDPERDIASYTAMLGFDGSMTSFMYEARQQSRFYHRPEFTAEAVNSYIRAGFGRAG